MVQVGHVGLGFGCYFGVIIQSTLFDGMKKYATPNVHKEGKAVARLLLSALVSAPIMGLYFIGFA
jgi:hypothetical protein